MKRVALALTGWPDRVKIMVEAAQLAEKSGFEMIWSAEDYFTGRDGITPLACFALSTNRVKLGSCVISPHMRSPGLIAATMATLDEISDSRIVLGLGACLDWTPMFSEDVAKIRFLKTMKETIELTRKLFSEKNAVFHNKNITIRGDPYWWPDAVVRPVRERIPIYVGARGPRMSQLAAEIADGLIIEVGIPVPVVKKRIEHFQACAEQAGRDPNELDIACLVAVSVTEDGAEDQATRRFVASRINKYDETTSELAGVDLDEVETVKTFYRKGGIGEASKYVSEDSVKAYMASGSTEECIRKLKEYVAAGVMLPTIVSIGRNIARTIHTGEEYATEKT